MMSRTRRNLTEADNLYRLTPRQNRALELVFAGETDGEVAEQIQVSRQTVNEWRNHHPAFRAAYNRLLQETADQFRHRIIALRGKALNVLEDNLEQGNLSAAISLLRIISGVRLTDAGPTDPHQLLQIE